MITSRDEDIQEEDNIIQPQRAAFQARYLSRNATELWCLVISAIGGGLIALLPFAINHRAYFHDDMQSQYMPVFMAVGHSLLQGHWPSLTLQVVNGGALLGEHQYGLLNPVSLLSYALIANLRDLETAAAVLSSIHYAILASGTYFLTRVCGSNRPFALLASVTFASNNFIFYWFSTSWFPGLVSTAWLVWAVGFLLRAHTGRLWWVAATVSTYLTITAGWPLADLALGVVAVTIIGGGYFRSGIRSILAPASSLLVAGLASLPAILPLIALGTTAERATAAFFNNGIWEHNFYGVLAVSSPLFLGHVWMSHGLVEIQTPMFLAAWYLLPIAPFIDWPKLRNNRTLLAIGILAVIAAMATQGPEQIASVRFPFRYLPYLHLALLCGFAVAVSRAELIFSRGRKLASGGMFLVALIMSIQAQPGVLTLGVMIALVLAPFLAVPVVVFPKRVTILALSLFFGTAFLFLTTRVWFPQNENLPDWHTRSVIGKISDLRSIPTGYSITVGDLRPPYLPDHGTPSFGNMNLTHDRPAFLGYTPIGYRQINKPYCVITHGIMCSEAAPRLLESSDVAGLSLADLLKIDVIWFLRPENRPPEMNLHTGWRCANKGSGAECLRIRPRVNLPGSLSYVSPGIVASRGMISTAEREEIIIRTRSGQSNLLIFNRLAFRGYEATFMGRPIEVRDTTGGLLMIRLPEAAGIGALVLTYRPPFIRPSFVALALAFLGLVFVLATWPLFGPARLRREVAHTRAVV